jgi:hypothetical protein
MNVKKYIVYDIRKITSKKKWGNTTTLYVDTYDSGFVGDIKVVTDPITKKADGSLSRYEFWVKDSGN